MVPKFQDPACIKFVNGKFILATNDPANPISLVRQKTKGIDTDVIVTLSTGETYDDTISSISRLVEVTSNKGWLISIDMGIEITISTESYYGRDKIIDGAQTIFQVIHDYAHLPNSEYYLPVSKMIPDRIVLQSVSSKLTFRTYAEQVRGSGTVTMEYMVLAPAKCIVEVVDELSDNLIADFRRETNIDISCVSSSGRYITNSNTTEYSLDYALDAVLTTDVERAMLVIVDGRSCDLEYDDIDQFAELLVGTVDQTSSVS